MITRKFISMERIFYALVVLVGLVVAFAVTRRVVNRELSLTDDRMDDKPIEILDGAYLALGLWLVSMLIIDFS